MTRRAFVAALTAAFAGRKLAPAVHAHVHSAYCNHILPGAELSADSLRAAIAQYGPVGFKVSSLAMDDDVLPGLAFARMGAEQRRREEELVWRLDRKSVV